MYINTYMASEILNNEDDELIVYGCNVDQSAFATLRPAKFKMKLSDDKVVIIWDDERTYNTIHSIEQFEGGFRYQLIFFTEYEEAVEYYNRNIYEIILKQEEEKKFIDRHIEEMSKKFVNTDYLMEKMKRG